MYVFSIATKEVIVFDYSKTISNGGKSPVIIKTWNDFFLCKSVQRRSLTARDSSGKLSQAEYAARVDEYNKEEELGNRSKCFLNCWLRQTFGIFDINGIGFHFSI